MYVLVIVLLFAVCTSAKPDNRIADGVDAKPHEFPYQVSLQYLDPETNDYVHYCGGTILNSDHVLTAEHCKPPQFELKDLRVVAGAHDFANPNGFEQPRAIKSFVLHEKKIVGRVGPFDLGMITLTTPFDLSDKTKIQAAQLPEKDYNATGNAIISGWGFISMSPSNVKPKVLQKAVVEIFDDKKCRELWFWESDKIHDTNICVGKSKKITAACKGDSGGPLSQKRGDKTIVVGVASWAYYLCGKEDRPSVYVETAHFLDWIEKKMN